MKLTIATILALVLATSAAAGVTGRARVGVTGRNDTLGYSPALWVDVASPSSYRTGCCTDVDSGEWLGPSYQASDNASIHGNSSISWRVIFDRRPGNVTAVADANLVQHWRTVATEHVSVPHLVGRIKVGSIPVTAIVTRAPAASSAQVEGALAFPLCPGLHAVADFDVLKPYAGPTGTGGTFRVSGTAASAWNRQQLDAALRGVSLVGYLPVHRVTAVKDGTTISGRVTDCLGHPMPGVTVSGGGATAKTDDAGMYRLTAARASSVAVTAGGATASGVAR